MMAPFVRSRSTMVASAGGALLVKHLPEIINGAFEPQPQNDALATYAHKLKPADAELDWRRSATELERVVRAYNPTPGASFRFGDEIIKCWRAETVADKEGHAGTVLAADSSGIDVACCEGAIRMLEVQRSGRKRITAGEFAGQSALVGKRFE